MMYVDRCIRKIQENDRFKKSKFILIHENLPGHNNAGCKEYFYENYGIPNKDYHILEEKPGSIGIRKNYDSTVKMFQKLCLMVTKQDICVDPDCTSLGYSFDYIVNEYYSDKYSYLRRGKKEYMSFPSYLSENLDRCIIDPSRGKNPTEGFKLKNFTTKIMVEKLYAQLSSYGPDLKANGKVKIHGKGKGEISMQDDNVITLEQLCLYAEEIFSGKYPNKTVAEFMENAYGRKSFFY